MTSILAATALTTYAAAKSRLNTVGEQVVDADHQNDVERLINAVSDAACLYCGFGIAYASRAEKYAPPRGPRLHLDSSPLVAVSALTLGGATVSDYVIEDAWRGTLWRNGGWDGAVHELRTSPHGVSQSTLPGSAQRVLAVTYTGGYVTAPQEAASATGGATLGTRTGTGAGSVTGTAGALATGTLVVDVDPGGSPYDITLTWNGGAAYVVHDIAAATLAAGIDLATVDSDLAGLTWATTSTVGLVTLAESWDIVPASPASRTLPWDIEEAVLESVAASWRLRNAGFAADGATEKNTAIGRGVGGLLTDRSCDMLAPYRRMA